jgi:multiple sugar transport system substrate-binding protein
MKELKGLTWGHTRGFAPLAALGRVWEDFHPDERVTWTARSLWSFGEEPLQRYLDDYDLFVFDYPFAGEAIEAGWVMPLETLLPAEDLAACAAGTIGPLFDAFRIGGRQAALPLDVATHAAASRPDLLAALSEPLPADLDAVVSLARRTGKVAMPMRPTGIWGAFLSICAARGFPAFQATGREPLDRETALWALDRLGQLARHVDDWCFETYPVALLNRMAGADSIAYVPFTYGYSTYGMTGYAPHPLAFHAIPCGDGSGAILGGAGIGVSAHSREPALAARHALWLASETVQTTLYAAFGGQPAQRAAWRSGANDARVGGFFTALAASAESPYVRPNHPGFHAFQNYAAGRLHAVVTRGDDAAAVLTEIAEAWMRREDHD